MENNFDNLNEDEKNDLLQKYKNKMMQVLLNIYKRQRNILLKKYLDKRRNANNCDNESELNQIMNNENTEKELNSEEVKYEMDKLNNNFVTDKNKVLSKVIQN